MGKNTLFPTNNQGCDTFFRAKVPLHCTNAKPEYVYEPTEGDYTFLGWIGESYETMPAHDVTYTADILVSGIEQLRSDDGAQGIYDLMGRKVTDHENLKSGIYIVNGKKVLIK